MYDFKVGDKVVCIDKTITSKYLSSGEEYNC